MSDSSLIRRILIVGAAGQTSVVYERESEKRKKGTRALRPLEKAIRRRAEADKEAAEDYLKRHNRSNERRKDGWLRDLVVNVVRTSQKSATSGDRDRN
jgi:hypothetical protein